MEIYLINFQTVLLIPFLNPRCHIYQVLSLFPNSKQFSTADLSKFTICCQKLKSKHKKVNSFNNKSNKINKIIMHEAYKAIMSNMQVPIESITGYGEISIKKNDNKNQKTPPKKKLFLI